MPDIFSHGKKGSGPHAPTTYPRYIPVQIRQGYQYTNCGSYNVNYGRGGTIYGLAFHDETVGFNGYYFAGPGYDEVTGIGSPIVYELIALA